MPDTTMPDTRPETRPGTDTKAFSASYDTTLETALAWHRQGKGAVIATVVQTWGSSPRPVGSILAISGDAEIEGSVSGGCVEGAVVAEAMEVLDTREGRLLTYGVSDDDAFAVGLACGGTISISVQPISEDGDGLHPDMLAEICAARAERRPIAYVVSTETWERRTAGPEEFPDRFRADKSGYAEDGSQFVAVYNPPLRMVVVGAVHIAQPLMQMARLAGYDATLVDPREAFGAAARFPGEKLVNDWPDEALREHGLDARTAVVTLTHDPKIDDPAIIEALRSKVFYLGCLGSTRTHAKRVARLEEQGFTAEEIGRIHAPVGLDIGARSPAEIALSVMAEITQVLRKG